MHCSYLLFELFELRSNYPFPDPRSEDFRVIAEVLAIVLDGSVPHVALTIRLCFYSLLSSSNQLCKVVETLDWKPIFVGCLKPQAFDLLLSGFFTGHDFPLPLVHDERFSKNRVY